MRYIYYGEILLLKSKPKRTDLKRMNFMGSIGLMHSTWFHLSKQEHTLGISLQATPACWKCLVVPTWWCNQSDTQRLHPGTFLGRGELLVLVKIHTSSTVCQLLIDCIMHFKCLHMRVMRNIIIYIEDWWCTPGRLKSLLKSSFTVLCHSKT